MAAYLIASITVTDPVLYDTYRAQVPPVIARLGGRYVVRGGAVSKVEGDLHLDRVVVLEFDTRAAAQAFCDSPDYAPLAAIRQAATRTHSVIVDGYTP